MDTFHRTSNDDTSTYAPYKPIGTLLSDTGGRIHQKSDDGTCLNPSTRQVIAVSPRFLFVKRKDDNFEKVNPVGIYKVFYGLTGKSKSAKKVREGLLVESKTIN